MPITIKLPKIADVDSGMLAESSTTRSKRQSKRRQAALYSDDDDDGESSATGQDTKPPKRARVDRQDEDEDVNVDIDVDAEEDIDIEEEEEDAPADDTRFLPPALRKMKVAQAQSSQKTKVKSKKGAGKKKRTVVWSDDEDDGGYNTAEQDSALRSDDDDFVPQSGPPKKSASAGRTKGKGSTARIPKIGRSNKDERETSIKQESRPSSVLKRSVSAEDDQSPAVKEEAPADDPTPPPLKRPKLPPIKKNKTSGNNSSLPPKPPAKPVDPQAALAMPAQNNRRPAATVNNADFDLRDKSVYAQLFTKLGGATPNAGLNRKEREEQRRRELNKMRDEARAKRFEDSKEPFDLQASHEKIQRYVEKLINRKSAAIYPNMLGGAFKDAYDRTKLAGMRNGQRLSS